MLRASGRTGVDPLLTDGDESLDRLDALKQGAPLAATERELQADAEREHEQPRARW